MTATAFNEGDNCPICKTELAFRPLGECTCWSGCGTSGWSAGPCRACSNGDLFCEKCDLYIDEIAKELLADAVARALRGIGEAIAKERPNIEMRRTDAALVHRAIRQHHTNLPANELWLPGIGGRI
jgi:hypothetical protein